MIYYLGFDTRKYLVIPDLLNFPFHQKNLANCYCCEPIMLRTAVLSRFDWLKMSVWLNYLVKFYWLGNSCEPLCVKTLGRTAEKLRIAQNHVINANLFVLVLNWEWTLENLGFSFLKPGIGTRTGTLVSTSVKGP